MGYIQIDNDLFDSLDPNEVVVYLAIKRHMPNAYPGYQRLAEVSKLSRSSISRALKSLRDKGIVVWRKTGRTNIYLLTESMKEVSQNHQMVHTEPSEVSQRTIRSVPVTLKEEQENKNKRRTPKPRPASPVTSEKENGQMDWDKPALNTDAPEPALKRTRKTPAVAKIVPKDSMDHCMSVFQSGMISLNIRLWSRRHLRKLLFTLHQDHSWEEIATLIEEFVRSKGDEVRYKSKAYDPVVLFQQSLNTGFERHVLPKQGSEERVLDMNLPGDRIIAKVDRLMAAARARAEAGTDA